MHHYIAADFAWLGVDRIGCVAIFTTASLAPLPAAVVDGYHDIGLAERLIEQLDPVGECSLLKILPRSDDYVLFARNGFFAYDVDAGHGAGFTYSYHMISRPTVARLIASLDPQLATLVSLVHFDTLDFRDSQILPVHRLTPCELPPGTLRVPGGAWPDLPC